MHDRVVFFDFDGVIVDSFNLAYHLMKMRETGLTALEYRDRFNDNIYKHFDPGGVPETSTTSKSFRDFFKLYTPQILSLELIAHIDEAVRALAQSYTLIINSSTPASTIRSYLELHRLEGYFDDILGPEHSLNKTVKFTEALKERAMHATDAVFITDTLGDIHEANALSLASIAVSWGYHEEDRLKKGEPYAIAHHPNELPLLVEKFFTTQ